jgi:hypothetical protein
MSRLSMLILVVVAAVAVSACGSPSSSVSQRNTTPTPASVASGLEALLITDLPTGYVQQPDSVGSTGPSDLAKAASDDGGPNATAVLTADGFEGGYQRLWKDSSPTNLIAYIYVFSNPTGAANYEQRVVSALGSQPGGSLSHPFTVSGVPGASGLYGTASGSPVVAVAVAKGDYLVQIAMQGPNATVATATTVFQEQLARFSS